ncbi:MAG: helix-turn-helix domain-containing protein [Rhodobacteraceae bacterium]|nr:helix-turn-helix domain-containing protein [Paracoccaceae bacterium]
MDNAMPVLPLPLIAALVLALMGLRAWVRGETPWPLLLLIGISAAQMAIVAGRLHYGLSGLSWVQPVLALAIPPLAWLAFVAATRRPLAIGDCWHLAVPGFGLFARLTAPQVLDPVIILAFLAYGLAVLLTLRKARELAHAPFAAGDRPLRLWRWLAFALLGSAASDVIILTVVMAGQQAWLGWVVTLFSTASLATLGALMLLDDAALVAEAEDDPPQRMATDGDAALVAALEELMVTRQLWRDPDLTLARLARRMGVPAKALSGAVNRVRGENISRVINGWRINHAADLLRGGTTVTAAMLGAGFNTKSNFNREFLRVMGLSPTDWLQRNPVVSADGPQYLGDNRAGLPR